MTKHGEKVTHVARGSHYTVMAIGKVQCAAPLADNDEVVIYRGEDGQWWARPTAEFEDGRFEPYVPESRPAPCPMCEDGREVPEAARPWHCSGCGKKWLPTKPNAKPEALAAVEVASDPLDEINS
jgi:ribosomal protein L37AE/L43A